MKDEKLIPPGPYCYRVVRLKPGEFLSSDIDRFGKDLREFSYHRGFKEVLCPYWFRTDYGMARCEFTGEESLFEGEKGAMELAIAHYGSREAVFEVNHSCYLQDEIKICGIREDEEATWEE